MDVSHSVGVGEDLLTVSRLLWRKLGGNPGPGLRVVLVEPGESGARVGQRLGALLLTFYLSSSATVASPTVRVLFYFVVYFFDGVGGGAGDAVRRCGYGAAVPVVDAVGLLHGAVGAAGPERARPRGDAEASTSVEH